MTIRILLADDHKIIRDGLRNLLEKQSEMVVVGEAENGIEAIQKALELEPHVVIMDVSMGDMNGMEATCEIHKALPAAKIIALSMHSDKRYVTRMLKVGACAYLLKHCAFTELVRAIHAVLKGNRYLSPGITDIVIDGYLDRSQPLEDEPSSSSLLSPRERQVLQLIAEGKSSKEAGHALFVSIRTIESHRLRIMDKLNIRTIAELTKFAIREGLTTLES